MPAPGTIGGPHLDSIILLYAAAGALAALAGFRLAPTLVAATAWEVYENIPAVRARSTYSRPDTLRDSTLELGALALGHALARGRPQR